MKVVVCLCFPNAVEDILRFAKVCDLPMAPFIGLKIYAHVGTSSWFGTVYEIEVSTASPLLVALVTFGEEPGADQLPDKLKKDTSWRQFGGQDANFRDCIDGPEEEDCLEMLVEFEKK